MIDPDKIVTDTEARARAAGWIAESEYNGEDDGVRHPETGNWTEHWQGACAQLEERQ